MLWFRASQPCFYSTSSVPVRCLMTSPFCSMEARVLNGFLGFVKDLVECFLLSTVGVSNGVPLFRIFWMNSRRLFSSPVWASLGVIGAGAKLHGYLKEQRCTTKNPTCTISIFLHLLLCITSSGDDLNRRGSDLVDYRRSWSRNDGRTLAARRHLPQQIGSCSWPSMRLLNKRASWRGNSKVSTWMMSSFGSVRMVRFSRTPASCVDTNSML